jgi:glycosyltransferase involved in cell wall biosynthesis
MSVLPIDVVMPVYNGEAFVEAGLESVFAQTALPSRIIVVNDGSTDHTAERVKMLFEKQVALLTECVLLDKKNGGLSSARNAGVLESRSKFVAFLDADDVWLPQKLEFQYGVFQSNTFTNLGAVYCDFDQIDFQGNPLPHHPRMVFDPELRGKIFEKLLIANYIASSASGLLCKRECFEKVGMFDEALPSSEDWDMWLRISTRYEFDVVPQKLVKIRRHSASMSRDAIKMYESNLVVLQKRCAEGIAEKVAEDALRSRLFVNAPSLTAFLNVVWDSKSGRFEGLRTRICPTLYCQIIMTIRFIASRLFWRTRNLISTGSIQRNYTP